jgi:hypothetical protein
MLPFVTNRGAPLIGLEALSLQGIPVEDVLLTRESEKDMADLAGNAMTTTVVGAAIMSALLVAKKTLLVGQARKDVVASARFVGRKREGGRGREERDGGGGGEGKREEGRGRRGDG